MKAVSNYRVTVEFFVLHSSRILLAKRAAPASGESAVDVWGAPAGKAKFSETPLEALFRETREELNLAVEVIRELDVRTTHFVKDEEECCRLIFSYLVRPRDNDISCLVLNHENVKVMWIDKVQFESEAYVFEHENTASLLRAAFNSIESH